MSTHTTFAVARMRDIGNPGSREFAVFAGAWPLRGFLVRKGDRIFAYVNRCPHAGQPLNRSPEGFLDASNQSIMCRSHGAMFDIETGLCVAGICSGQALQSLPVRVIEDVVLLTYDPLLQQWI
jgi:nitrite reductase/ring-hydroxylating ferredoxin subunit